MMTANVISKKLSEQAENVARLLLPNGKRSGNEWRIGSIDGETGESLGVHLEGQKAGVWSDFATGESGDLLSLWALKRNITLPEAIKDAMRYLGISNPKLEGQKLKNFEKPKHKISGELNNSSAVYRYLTTERKLTPETVHKFKIGERGRDIVFNYVRDGELVLIKYLSLDRVNGKKQISAEKDCEPCLFGWDLIPKNSRSIVIDEGEIDAMTLNQYGFPALSVPFGAGAGAKQKWLEYEFDRLAMFDEIFLCFDPDEEGRKAIAELAERLGRHRCRIVELPFKDPNECLQNNVSTETMQKCFDNARSLDPEELKRASMFVDDVINMFYPDENAFVGYDAPWDKAKGKVIFRNDELSVWTGINGHGKSQFLGQLMLHLMKSGAKVCVASLEIKPKRLLKRLAQQASCLAEPTEEYIRTIHDWYDDRLWLFDLVGNAKSKRLLEVFLYARQRYSIDVFVIDSFMKLDIAEDDYKAQKALMEELCDFKNQHDCQIHIVVHPRKGSDETKAPSKLDNKGTGAISDLADNCFCIWRNKEKESLKNIQAQGVTLTPAQLEKLKAFDVLWICDKQRNGDWEGSIGFCFDPKSLQYLPSENAKLIQYVNYSCTKNFNNQE